MLKNIHNFIKDNIISSKLIFKINNILGISNNMEDSVYLKSMYKIYMKKNLNLSDPETFNEKIQWLKLYDRKPEYTMMVDKYKVREYIAEKIGAEYLIPLIGVWNNPNEIDYECLPNQFVLKCNHDSGGLSICRDKDSFDFKKAKKKLTKSLKTNYYYSSREWVYKDVKPLVLAEKYMEDRSSNQLTDYKFYCFNGEVKFLYISTGLEDHSTARIGFYDLDFNKMKFRRSDYALPEKDPIKPQNFDKMIEIAKKLSHDIPFIRVDLYNINDKIYFSELTFYPCSGYMPFEPEEWDYKLGQLIELPEIRNN